MTDFTFIQSTRSVLHYSARCENVESRSAIDEECTTHGADKFAKDSVSLAKDLHYFAYFYRFFDFIADSHNHILILQLGNAPDYYIENEFPQPIIKRGRVSPTGQ